MLNYPRLEQWTETFMQAERIPGLALVRDQEVLYAQEFGRTSVEAESLTVANHFKFLAI